VADMTHFFLVFTILTVPKECRLLFWLKIVKSLGSYWRRVMEKGLEKRDREVINWTDENYES
jgi:hypothetical protein